MGTDIHLAAEVKNDEGEWVFIPGPIIDCWSCEGTGMKTSWETQAGKGNVKVHSATVQCGWCTNDGTTPEYEGDDGSYYRERYVGPGKTRDHWYSDRNYTVFAVLGNVRNGSGFAGVYTHDPIKPISCNRGIPADATPETLQVLSDEHSGTWMTLREIMDYDWKQPMHRSGVIDLDTYERLRPTGARPDGWSGSISGPGIATVTTSTADALIAGTTKVVADRVYVKYEWADTLEDYAQGFLDRMKMLAVEAGERECRLIMDFDS